MSLCDHEYGIMVSQFSATRDSATEFRAVFSNICSKTRVKHEEVCLKNVKIGIYNIFISIFIFI